MRRYEIFGTRSILNTLFDKKEMQEFAIGRQYAYLRDIKTEQWQ